MELHKFEEDSKYGYRDENETIVIPAKYEEAKDFIGDYAIVKYNGSYGVIYFSDEPVIGFVYTSIEEHYQFFECKAIQEHEEKEKIVWYNKEGVLLHQGKAKVLSEKFLCISNGNKYGIIDQDGKHIINCLYDEITQKNDLFIVLREDKLGLYETSGNVILDTFCTTIESVVIDNNPMTLGLATKEKKKGNHYLGYNKLYFFDADIRMNAPHGDNYYDFGSYYLEKYVDRLYREKVKAEGKNTISYIFEREEWDISKPIIVSSDNSKMLFLKSDGILRDSEYDDIQQLTQVCYVVKKNNLYGVYRIDTKALIVPIEYDNIRFYGGHTILVCKDNLWGALSLVLDTNIFYKLIYKVSIPTEYLEIKILDDYQQFFGCKVKKSYSSEEYYTIVRSNGQEIYDISELECDSQFVYIDSSHFMTSIGGKFGFINSQGQKVIPFKYDEITKREDGLYYVRIGKRWGILTIEGREVAPVKYSLPLPKQLDNNTIVVDEESNCFGVINSSGIELIPTIYEHLQDSEDERFYYYGYGGYYEEYWENFFAGNVSGAKWGVVNIQGKQLINAKYDCFKLWKGFILAGRDGGFVCDFYDSSEDYHSCSDYGGVYDLYNGEGEFLIGGFREFQYDKRNGLFIFFFGGEWIEYSEHDDLFNFTVTGKKFERGVDLWLILDKDLKTIIRNKQGNSKLFEKGFIGKIEIKKEDDKIKHIYNMPIELMAKGFSHVAINSVILNDSNLEYHKSYAVDIATGKKTRMYSKIEQVTEKLFFFADGDNVGITNINSDVLIGECLLITYPINNYVLIGKKESEKNFSVLLYNLENLAQPFAVAIQRISEDDLIDYAEGHWLKMGVDNSLSGSKSLIMPNSRFLENKFKELVSTKEGTDHKFGSYDNSYFFSNDWRFNHDEENYGDGGNEWQDHWDPSDAFDGEPDAYWNID